jgi:hypothetical protein
MTYPNILLPKPHTLDALITSLSPDVDLTRVKQKTVRKFIHNNGLRSLEDFANISHSLTHNPDISTFHRHVKTFSFKHNIEDVWSAYKTIGPVQTCNGSMLSFGLQYSRRNHKITYHEDDHGSIEKGQIVFLHLRLVWGLVNIAVGHEITEVNEDEKFIQMCYLKGGASRGTQYIRLKETPEGNTEIIHETFYKSHSDFRDKQLYPALHGLVISEFHRNVRLELESKNFALSNQVASL